MRKDLRFMLENGNFGNFSYGQVTQIVMLTSDKKIINYFTHIDISSSFTAEAGFKYLTKKPICINKSCKLAISQCTLKIEEILSDYTSAIGSGTWKCSKDKDYVILDDIFDSGVKYIPYRTPTQGKGNQFVPIEQELYGTNFLGGYYIAELYSCNSKISEIITDKDIGKIQSIIHECGLNYRLDCISDRIGNVICKIPVEVIAYLPTAATDDSLTVHFNYSGAKEENRYCLFHMQEHDGLFYENRIIPNYDFSDYSIEENQLRNIVTIYDCKISMPLFIAEYNNITKSDNFSRLVGRDFIQVSHSRVLHMVDGDVSISLTNIQEIDPPILWTEMHNANLRRAQQQSMWLHENKYFMSYSPNMHDKAIKDLKDLIKQNAIGDIQEIWIIDPYLTADDISKTVLYCEAEGITIKALCEYSSIHGNQATKNIATDYENFRKTQGDYLKRVLASNTDLKLEYRSVHGPNGQSFHDRYIMLKYRNNRPRIWSIGASINAIAKKHTIIQIIDAPETVEEVIVQLWNLTDVPECIIYKC